jgi:hypothetical protein
MPANGGFCWMVLKKFPMCKCELHVHEVIKVMSDSQEGKINKTPC